VTTIYVTETPIGYQVQFAYDPQLVFLLKDTVLGQSRSWDPESKTWTIKHVYDLAAFTECAELYGHAVIGFTDANSQPQQCTSSAVVDWAGSLLDAVGKDRQKTVYRALVRVLHPDAGGDARLFDALTRAYERRAA